MEQEECPSLWLTSRRDDVQYWHPPDLDTYKLNFDAAVFNASNTAGIGVIVRDWRGETITTLSKPILSSHSIANMETLACRRAIKFAAKTGLRKVVFEGDSTLVINAITQGWLDTFGGLRQKLIILF